MLIYGLVVVIMMQIRPMGIMGHLNTRTSYLESLLQSVRKKNKKDKEVDANAAGN